jgi:hypothetical protein
VNKSVEFFFISTLIQIINPGLIYLFFVFGQDVLFDLTRRQIALDAEEDGTVVLNLSEASS